MKLKRKQPAGPAALACQLRDCGEYPFGALKRFVPLGTGEEQIYRELREAIPVLDAAVGKLIRLSGGFMGKCRNAEAQTRLDDFLRTVPCGYGQVGIDGFFTGYMESLLVYGRAIGEMVVDDNGVRAVCWGDVTKLQIRQGGSALDTVIYGPDKNGHLRPLPYQKLLLFSTLHPEPNHPYGVSLFRGMPFLADILMRIYHTVGENWTRAGNVRYSVICKDNEVDPALAQERGKAIAQEWSKAMEEGKNGTVRDFVAVGDVEIKVIGGEAPILDSQVPVRQILEQLVAKTGLPPFLLGLNWSTTERMSTQQADMLTTEITAIRRTLTPVLERICRMWLRMRGWDSRFEVVWDDINLQDEVEEARAELYREQARKLRIENDRKEKGE